MQDQPAHWFDTPPTEREILSCGPFGDHNITLVKNLRQDISDREDLIRGLLAFAHFAMSKGVEPCFFQISISKAEELCRSKKTL